MNQQSDLANLFVGRDDQLRILQNWQINPDSRMLVNFYGLAGIGKSRLAKEIVRKLPEHTVYIDFKRPDMQFREEIISVISERGLKDSGLRNEYQQFLEYLDNFENEAISRTISGLSQYERKNIAQVNIGPGAKVFGDISAAVGEKKVSTEAQTEKRIVKLTKKFVELLSNQCAQGPIILLFDHCERITYDQVLLFWLLDVFFSSDSELAESRIAVILFSREKIRTKTDHCPPYYVLLPNLTIKECKEYLEKVSLNEHQVQTQIIQLTKGHPYCLFLAVQAFQQQGLQNDPEITQLIDSDAEELLIAQYLMEQIIDNENEEEIRDALIYGGIFRFINASKLSFLLDISLSNSLKIINKLGERAFLVESTQQGLWSYHDILHDLLIAYLKKNVSTSDYAALHSKAIKYYKAHDHDKNLTFNEKLMCIVEPLFHFLEFDEEQGWNYFESNYKPRLDRREKDICRILLSQIEFSSLKDKHIEAWFRFRLGDYWREFGEYEKALSIYRDLSERFISTYAIKDYLLITSLSNNIGWVYLFYKPEKNISKAIEHFNLALDLSQEFGFPHIRAMAYNNLGIAWSRNKKGGELSIHYYLKSLEITESADFKEDFGMRLVAGMSHQNLANSYLEEKKYVTARTEFNLAFSRYTEAQSQYYQNKTLMLFSNLLINEGQYRQAINALRLALDFWKSTKDLENLAHTLYKLGACHEKLEELDLMSEAHAALCKISLYVSLEFHNFCVTYLIPAFARYLLLYRGKSTVQNYLLLIIDEWAKDEALKNIVAFIDYLNNLLNSLLLNEFFSIVDTSTYHRIGCRVGKRIHPESHVLLKETSNEFIINKLRRCKYCLK